MIKPTDMKKRTPRAAVAVMIFGCLAARSPACASELERLQAMASGGSSAREEGFTHGRSAASPPMVGAPARAAKSAQALKSSPRVRRPMDGGIADSKIPDVAPTVKAAVEEYFEPQGAFLDFAGGLLGGVFGFVNSSVMFADSVRDRVEGWSKAKALPALPVALAGVLATAALGTAAGAVLGIGKLGQALGEAVEGKF